VYVVKEGLFRQRKRIIPPKADDTKQILQDPHRYKKGDILKQINKAQQNAARRGEIEVRVRHLVFSFRCWVLVIYLERAIS